MIKKNIIGILVLIASNAICSADIYKDYHEASDRNSIFII